MPMPADRSAPIVVHHMAALDDAPHPPNSLAAIAACLAADAPFIEIDVTALAADDYLLVHDPDLESETSGSGPVSAATAEAARDLRLKHRGQITAEPPALLSQVVELFVRHGGRSRLQIDFKNVLPMRSDEPLRRLVGLIEPLGERVLVSSGADWHLRRLRQLAPWLAIGFDIGFYLDYRPRPVDARLPPYRLGAYGYHDDHILAAQALLDPAAYLAERSLLLHRALPEASIWYVGYPMIARALADGFNLADWLHGQGILLDAWTLDVTSPDALAHLDALRRAGVDQFTTNTPHALAARLSAANGA